ncbi:hypothetical protein DYI37_10425 [Fulvimarina endophytica]|uniref:Polysaccharide deacetylase n=1 Tax=Fulvimarina endophytica TaxID=2293836 RepID=A0A371X334_9HYPH|nr:hypothetical protein [Fulvimarina endophytica]RFC63444.1 hypothetical protein DYI37_10425 [Fulvimarina endophytica]
MPFAFRASCVLGLLLGVLLSCVGAASAARVDRTVIALYDSTLEPTPSDTLIHTNAEMPLNHLGFVLDYYDVSQDLPSRDALGEADGVLTMFPGNLRHQSAYFRWLRQNADVIRKLIVLGEVGGDLTDENRDSINALFERIGLRVMPQFVERGTSAERLATDETVIGFEVPPDPILPAHPLVEPRGEGAEIALSYEVNAGRRVRTDAVVAFGEGGAYAAPGFFLYYDDALNMKRWIVDPFVFFHRALDVPVFPVPDTTTVLGRRLYFSHVDGDGWNSVSQIERYRGTDTSAAEVMIAELFEAYPDMPVSLGFVLGDLDPDFGARPDSEALVRRAFALPQVEVASHSRTHPFVWGFFEHYDRARELELMASARGEQAETVIDRLSRLAGIGPSQDAVVAAYHDLPRAYMRDPFDLENEIGGALAETEALAPEGKPIALFQWTGNAKPFEAAIAATRAAGVRNINGGDIRFDDQRPSTGYIAPISRFVGGERQIYAVNANENIFTDLWTDRFSGFVQMRETFERTGAPLRLRGINLYYHTYSAERAASLDAIKSHLDWVRTQDVIAIHASRYAAIADGFFSTRIEAIGPMEWRVSDRDGLDTLRFDAAGDREVDIARSRGVLGSSRFNKSLYVALDPAERQAVVALAPFSGNGGEPSGLAEANLSEGSWIVSAFSRGEDEISFDATGFGPGEFAFRDVPQGRYRLDATGPAGAAEDLEVDVGADGLMRIELDMDARQDSVRVSIVPLSAQEPVPSGVEERA